MDNGTSNGCGLLLIMFLAISAFSGFLVLFGVQTESVTVAIPTIALQANTPVVMATQAPTTAPIMRPTMAVTVTEITSISPTIATAYNTTPLMVNVLGSGDLSVEAVELVNTGDTVDLTGWRIVDAQGNKYTFPTYTLYSGGVVRVMTRSGDDTPIALFWDRDTAIWSPGETLTLRDQIGTARTVMIVGHDS